MSWCLCQQRRRRWGRHNQVPRPWTSLPPTAKAMAPMVTPQSLQKTGVLRPRLLWWSGGSAVDGRELVVPPPLPLPQTPRDDASCGGPSAGVVANGGDPSAGGATSGGDRSAGEAAGHFAQRTEARSKDSLKQISLQFILLALGRKTGINFSTWSLG